MEQPMSPMHLFSPLRRQPGFPMTSVDITIADVRYDLILPDEISNLLLMHVIDSKGAYRRVDRFCDPLGIEEVRARPTLLDDAYVGVPTFAVAFGGVEDVQDDEAVVGYVALRLAVGPLAARQLYNRARKGESIDPELSEYIIGRDTYFSRCGGFELLRIRYYFDDVERYAVMLDLEANEPPAALLKERKRTSFRESLITRHAA